MSGIGVLGRVYICILLIFGVLFQHESELMFRGKVRGMAQEDDSENSSYSRVDKGKSIFTKPIPKKARSRRSGVVRLERIRLEEQQKKESPHHLSPSPSQSRSLDHVLPVNPNFDLHQSRDLPLDPISSDIPNKDRFFQPTGLPDQAIQEYDPPRQVQGNVNNTRSESIAGSSSGYNWNMLRPSGPIFIWPSPGLFYLQPFPMVSSPWASYSLPSSSLTRFMEPPSNQISSSSFSSIWPQLDQRVGLKRPYPSTADSVISDFIMPTQMLRGGLPSSTSASESNVNNENRGSNETLTRDFLSIAPPAASPASTSRISRFRHPNPAAAILPYRVDSVGFMSLPYQMEVEGEGDQVFVQGAQQPVCTYGDFFPSSTAQIGQATTSNNNGGEESLDLELRLNDL